jgi:hypothetical protein
MRSSPSAARRLSHRGDIGRSTTTLSRGALQNWHDRSIALDRWPPVAAGEFVMDKSRILGSTVVWAGGPLGCEPARAT